jgi:ABC-type transport system involved in cytochrome bd biosynthesis fused ATPase/permease subunit
MVQHPKTFELSLDAVTASWGKPFMRPVTTSVEPGEVLVLRGKSGAGKSTLALALCGALSYSGRARIGGIEISEFENLSSYVSASLQRGHVFNTTVRENLKIADSGVSDQDLLRVLSLVELEDIPLDAQLGELGRALSGGEIKRLAVARALLSPAPVLILDEPTEHLDASLAARIEARITEIAHKSARTVIVITHSGWLNSSRMALVERE